jgi:transglutaminase-like putative cysteine protease
MSFRESAAKLNNSFKNTLLKKFGNGPSPRYLTTSISVFLFLFLLLLLFVFPSLTHASSNFTTDYNVLYSVNENGQTRANLKITLTNKTTEFYASSYKVQVGFDNITNVTASDPDGPINPILEKTQDGYLINLNFNKKATGIDQKLNFNLSFDTPDVAKQYGNIWEINIPGIADPQEFNSFTVEIKVPPSFGKPTFTKPYKPVNNLIFDKAQLEKSGISISFGEKQIYSFHLTYHIKNDNLYPATTEIALPPSTNYQTVYIQNISPRPENVYLDKDGNWLAELKLGPSQKTDVIVDGKAEVLLSPKQQDLAPTDRKIYLEEKPYWQVNSSEITRLAKELKTPEAIYQFVVKALKYDFSRVTQDKPRLGAVNALKNPDSAVCLEYTDLFIALARAAGIPAREINGFAYTQNSKQRPLSLVKDILHAWPEYYDDEKKTWVMIDPTWGSTTGGIDYFNTLDFDHFAFVKKGIDSDYPIPAGGYKFISDKYTKDVAVDFSQKTPAQEFAFEVTSKIPTEAMTLLPIKGKVMIKNTSQNLLPPQLVTIKSSELSPDDQILQSPPIPPFGSAEVAAAFHPRPFLTNKSSAFTILVNGQTITHSIEISPLLIKKWWKIGGAAVAIFTIIILITSLKSWGLQIFRRR